VERRASLAEHFRVNLARRARKHRMSLRIHLTDAFRDRQPGRDVPAGATPS
jgi:hypothetical protein